jgi:TetR/AcrR family transcriptional regulator, cholesterol catabolism regulator
MAHSEMMTLDEPRSGLPDATARQADERYQRLMAVVRRAARGGYDAVSMRDIARDTQMSMTTIYQYCTTKDHLIAEAHLEWMEHFRDSMMRTPPKGRSAAARVLAYVEQITEAWTEHETLTRTLQRALHSVDPGVREVRSAIAAAYAEFMDIAIGDEPVADRDTIVEIIGHVIGSVTYSWMTGGTTAAEGRVMLERTIRVLLPKPPSPSRARRLGLV